MAQEHLVFQVTVESLARAVGPAMTLAMKDHLRALGIDYDRPLQATYPRAKWDLAFEYISEQLFPGEPLPVRHEKLGRRVLESFTQSIIGSVLIAIVRVGGPRRMIERTARNLRQANNYTELELEERKPNEFVMHFNHVSSVDFYRGMLVRALELSGAKNPNVTVETPAGERVEYLVRWD